jgi:hypothetical protein
LGHGHWLLALVARRQVGEWFRVLPEFTDPQRYDDG